MGNSLTRVNANKCLILNRDPKNGPTRIGVVLRKVYEGFQGPITAVKST